MARKAPEINSSSTADLAFLLLIFFLMTSTMDTDSGITRRLPPPVENTEVDIKVKERNLLNVMINKNDKMMVNGKPTDIKDLMDITKKFITPDPGNDKAPECKEKEIELMGTVVVNEGVVSLKNDRGTSYVMYIRVQNELARAYSLLKDEMSMQYFGTHFEDLTDEDKIKAINTAVPTRISEAEPENIQ